MKKYWALTGIIAVVLLTFVLSNSFWDTLSRKRAVRRAEKDLESLAVEVIAMRHKVSELETNPHSYEKLVRQELGYLRPGEKEIRFIKKTP